MTYLEMDIIKTLFIILIFSRFLLFLKYSPHPVIAFFFSYSPGMLMAMHVYILQESEER